MYYSVTDRRTRKKEIRVLLSGVEPKTFRLLVRRLHVSSSTYVDFNETTMEEGVQLGVAGNISDKYVYIFLISFIGHIKTKYKKQNE